MVDEVISDTCGRSSDNRTSTSDKLELLFVDRVIVVIPSEPPSWEDNSPEPFLFKLTSAL
jgi:hypothetical protein